MPNPQDRDSYIVEHTCTDVFGKVLRVLVGPFPTKEAALREWALSRDARVLYMNAPRAADPTTRPRPVGRDPRRDERTG